jgi:hypothetical protein
MLKRLASSYKLHSKILQTRQYATQPLLIRQSIPAFRNKHFFSNSYDKFQFQSSIEEFQHLESVWQKYSEEGEQDEVWIKTLIAEPKIPTETYDQISSLRKEIGELIKLGNNKCAIGKAETYKNLISEFYIREHPANLSALNNIAIIKKGNNEINEAKGILYQVFCGYAK